MTIPPVSSNLRISMTVHAKWHCRQSKGPLAILVNKPVFFIFWTILLYLRKLSNLEGHTRTYLVVSHAVEQHHRPGPRVPPLSMHCSTIVLFSCVCVCVYVETLDSQVPRHASALTLLPFRLFLASAKRLSMYGARSSNEAAAHADTTADHPDVPARVW